MFHPAGARRAEMAAAAPVIPEALATTTATWLGGMVVVVVVVVLWPLGWVVVVAPDDPGVVDPEATLACWGCITPSRRTVAATNRTITMPARRGGSRLSPPPDPLDGFLCCPGTLTTGRQPANQGVQKQAFPFRRPARGVPTGGQSR